jgi:hypothetical protein
VPVATYEHLAVKEEEELVLVSVDVQRRTVTGAKRALDHSYCIIGVLAGDLDRH